MAKTFQEVRLQINAAVLKMVKNLIRRIGRLEKLEKGSKHVTK
jgi:hypothetical protein